MSTSMGLLRVLILEDDEDIVDLLESILDSKYEFLTAANGLEGLQVAEAGEPDLIICDVMMPVMNGWDFITALREKPGFEKTPVIFLSALSAQDQIKKGYSLGAGLFLTKPIDPARLKRNIELYVDDHGIVPRPKRRPVDQVRAGSAEDFLKFAAPKPAAAPRIPAVPATPHAPHPPAAAPVARAGLEPHARTQAAEIKRMARPNRIRIMVVEDDPDTRAMLQNVLKERYEVVEAHDGMVAIERAVKFKPDVFVIDGMLPRMTGYQLTMILKKNREFYKAPIVFISAKASPRDQEYARSLGISHFLAKPFALAQFMEKVDEVTSRPDFHIRTDRDPLPESSVPENFTHYEQHRQAAETNTLAELEEHMLETRLKQQLK